MIPLTLELKDFLSYKAMESPLDLTDVHLACLSGANGNGKSALLDAITWALWGKARGCEGGHDQERLIRDGADEARVELTFELDGQVYRALRARTRKGKGDVHLHVRDGESWTDIGGESVTGTQQAISKLLRMEYETFVASAYILQGRADEFSRMNAADRKDVLGKILGLEIYERLADRAKESKKEQAATAEALRQDAEKAEVELLEIPEVQARLYEAEAGAAAAEGQRVAWQKDLEAAHERVSELRAVEAELRHLEQKKDELEATLRKTRDEIASIEKELSDAEAAAVVAEEAGSLAAELLALEESDHKLEDVRARDDELKREIAALEKRIDVERERIAGELRAAQAAEADAAKEIAALAGAWKLLEAARASLAALDDAAAERERLLARHTELVAVLTREEEAMKTRAAQRLELIERRDKLGEADAECPVCEQPLTKEHRSRIAAEVKAKLAGLAAADEATTSAIEKLTKEIGSVTERGRTLKKELASREELAGRISALDQQLARSGDLQAKLDAAQARIAEISAVVESNADSPTEREKLASIVQERRTIAYDPAAHKRVRERMLLARSAERTIHLAAQAAIKVEALVKQRTGATLRAEESQASIAATAADIAARSAGLAGLKEQEETVAAAKHAVEAAARDVVEHQTAAGRARDRLGVLAQTAERAKEARSRHAAARALELLYGKLAKTFGRDGIPARIISNAIPELEHEANRLLELLTDGRLTVKMELVRQTKSKTSKETLDITVFDTSGVRAYEMYSGGERLRIDFALRIALSALLARRANTRLETLVVDEGFGSQDAEGRSRLVEAIFRVRDQFRRVLVITHVEELKDQFPVRIDVEKDSVGGSRVRVS